ncbi:MAG: 2-oxoglutarate and iron-dependent oxygenase domain-containing protein [Candidatus Lustribacter sp.]
MPEIPIIDLSPIRSGATGLEGVAREIGAAARRTGFFTVVNHGIPARLCDDVFAAARAFFALPATVKEAISFERSPQYYGYSRMSAEQLHPDWPGDLKESYNMGRDLAPHDPDVIAGKPFHGVNLWPELTPFREPLLAFFAAQHALCIDLHRAVAVDLGAAPDFFDSRLDRTLGVLRLLHYPPHPGAFDDSLYGAAPHTDYGNLTVLMQDDVGGLEVQARDGRWISVDPVAGAFVCNIGDSLMRWTNDVYVSTPHRVVNASARERYSVAFFGDPNGDASIECMPQCCTPERPPKYTPTTYAEYLARRLGETYQPAARSETT